MAKRDLNKEFQILISLVCESVPEFRHYDLKKIAVSVGRSKARGKSGVWAYVVPLRYIGGEKTRRGSRWGRKGFYSYESLSIESHQPEACYLMTFLVPRFFSLTSFERIETIVHELYHLHPTLRGDLRRFPAPHIHHGPTPGQYRRRVAELTHQSLKDLPELAQHPLLTGKAEDFEGFSKKRFSIPRRVFKITEPNVSSETKRVPEQQSLFSPVLKWFGFSAIAGAFLVAALNGPRAIADSRVSPTEITLGSTVTLKRGSPLFATPSPTSTYAVQASVGQSLEFLKLSTNGRWALVKSASGQGWVPASWMIAGAGLIAPSQTVAKSGDAAASAVPLIPVPHPEIPWDPKLDRFVITKAGKLFESPSKFAIRFAVLEAEDEVKVEERSANGKWAKIKTTITGEEGWYPLEWVSARRQERIDQPGPWTLELSGLYGTRNYTYGFGGALAFNFLSHGTEKSPRDRFEIVLLGNYFKGFSYSDGASTLTASFFNMAAAARYMVSNSSGFWSGAVEAGAMYQILKTTAQGVQTSVLSSVGIPEVGSSVGFLAGLVGLYSFTPYFATEVGVRFFLSSNSSAMGFLGLAFRFL